MGNWKHIAVVLAAGKGKRMHTQTAKQYLLLREKPVLYYSLKVFQDSFVDGIILVAGEDEMDYCREQIVERYGFSKVWSIVAGGRERYHSVYQGLKEVRMLADCVNCGINGNAGSGERDKDEERAMEKTVNKTAVYIHDGARPFITEEILLRLKESVEQYGSAVAAMPVKDTVKIADADGFVNETPDRSRVWQVQTPQCFDFDWIYPAYSRLIEEEQVLSERGVHITDDAMAAEMYSPRRVRLVEADYRNIKITTPEDLPVAESFLKDIV